MALHGTHARHLVTVAMLALAACATPQPHSDPPLRRDALDDAIVERLVAAAVADHRLCAGCGGKVFVIAYADGSTEVGGMDCIRPNQPALDIVRIGLWRSGGTAAADVWLCRDGTLHVDCIDRFGAVRNVTVPLSDLAPRIAGR